MVEEEEVLEFVLDDRWPVIVPQSDILPVGMSIKHGIEVVS